MTEYDNELTFVLFKNDSENEKAPNFTGKAQVDEVEYRAVAWRRISGSGKPFISGKLERQDEFEARMKELSEDSSDGLGI